MNSVAANDANVGIAVLGASDRMQRVNFGLGFVCSVLLHGLILLPFVLMHDWVAMPLVIPMDIVMLADETAGPPQPDTAFVPQQKAGQPSSPAALPVGASPSTERPDDLEIKLHTLAKLRQPSVDTHLSENDTGLSHMSATSNNAVAAPYAMYAVRDFIRAQVERRWSLDLATLGGRNFSVLIRVEITSAGVVTKAEIVDTPGFAADKTYRDIALSARNAVLLSSPLALPSGHYDDVMDLTLSLSTRDALR